MFNCFLSLFVSVEVSNAYANVLSIIVFFSINFSFLDMLGYVIVWVIDKYRKNNMRQFVALDRWFKKFVISGIVSYMDNACLKFELMGCEEPAVEPLLGYDYGYSPCVGKFWDRILNLTFRNRASYI
jgi:hypothetical protein